MQTAPTVLSLLLVILSCTGWTNGLCDLENGTMARCQELKDVKYIETYHLETLKAPVLEWHLRPGHFDNLTSLRHLDLSGGHLKRIDSGCFRNLTNLRSLNLAENQIASLYSGAFQKLPHLHSLNLRKNKLRHLAPVITELKALKHLDVQGNPLQCDCATLLVRDMILKNGVKISKKVLCAGPKNMKSTPLFKPDASMICSLEEQDRQMQNDQPVAQDASDYEGSGTGEVEQPIDEEFIDVPVISSEPPKELEIETPAPETECLTTDADCPGKLSSKEDELFFDSSEKKDQIPIAPTMERKKMYKDALFDPVEGSGGDEEGSGEGSGTGTIFDGWDRNVDTDETTHSEEESQSLGDKLLDTLFNVFLSTTATPETKKDLDLEGEQFLNMYPEKAPGEPDETVETVDNNDDDDVLMSTTKIDAETTQKITTTADYSGVEEFNGNKQANLTQTHESKTGSANMIDELAEVSPAKQSKKGMGSYVVLATLLAILASLIMFAAYKGDFCRKKRKRGDVENGTEMKDLQKALLDSGNAAHPKVVTNGNVENVPLVEDATDHEETKGSSDHQDSARSQNGTADRVDPVKPPRKSNERSSFDESTSRNDSLPARTSPDDVTVNNAPPLPANGPPLSPGAQRVKITLQENPDSVPKTPILITRTMAGDNLVKSP
ncbi:leucine rich repeat protein windpipe [Halictus rubicundus]|uniref:leucine rich repeat protein windpipe n=1 Tax=Halictus rubicundus TaxID=77578 RepID=UPI0040352A5F